MKYSCHDCHMEIDVNCHKCKQPLTPEEIKHNNKNVNVAKCSKCEGMIKAPQCCGKDMEYN